MSFPELPEMDLADFFGQMKEFRKKYF